LLLNSHLEKEIANSNQRPKMKLYLSIFFLVVSAFTSYAAFETEPNDSPAAANPITPGQNTTGQLASATDQDWFGFSMSSAGTVNIVFDSPDAYSMTYFHTGQVRNAAGTIFASLNTGKDINFQTSLPSAGTYYLTVRVGPDGLRTGQYALNISTTSAPQSTAESEPNNAFGTANPLSSSQKLFGQLMSASDEDWFSFTTTGSGAVTVSFNSPETYSMTYFHTVQVRNAAGTIFASADTGKDANFLAGLPSSGTYYVVVRVGPDGLRT
jgi:hypothetical protein